MTSFLVIAVRAFMPFALVAGALLASPSARKTRKAGRRVFAGAALGLAAGGALHFLAGSGRHLTAVRVAVDGAAVAGLLAYALFFLFATPARRGLRKAHSKIAVGFAAALAAASAFSLLDLLAGQVMSATTVVNTELIVNESGLLLGVLLAAASGAVAARAASRGERSRAAFLLAVCALILVPRGAQLLLGLMRLDVIEASAGRLSFVARAGLLDAAAPYLDVLALAGLSIFFFGRRESHSGDELAAMPAARRRQASARTDSDARWTKAAACVCAALLLALSYNAYASRPPLLSRALPVSAGADGLVRVRIADVDDGELHRFIYRTAEGRDVRFFLLRKTGERGGPGQIAVVYDACMMCGDRGYIHRKHEVYCVACNVRILKPSLGKPGGCNPIPLEHRVEDGVVLISAAELGKGAVHFTQAGAG